MHSSAPRLFTNSHFSGPPAIPITLAPAYLASCTAIWPTAPAAALMTTVSPFFGLPISNIPKYAVRPFVPFKSKLF